jgi:hypothetical protein
MIHSILFLLLSCFIQTGAAIPADPGPLPDLDAFLQDIRKHLHSNRILQSEYTYTEKSSFRQLDSGDRVKKTENRVYEVYPSIEDRLTYRKLISKNEKPLSAEEIKENDRAYEKKRREWGQNANKSDKQRQEAERNEEEALNEAFHLYRIAMTGREQIEGIPVIALTFEPRPEYKTKTSEGKLLAKVSGKAWFSEADQELVRIEAELRDSLSFGFGVVARLDKGTRIVFERRKINNEVWLPALSRFTGTGRILLLRGFRIDQETFYSDYKKFSVETVVKIPQ